MDEKYYLQLDPEQKEIFFRDLLALMHLWQRDVKISINEDALVELRNWANKITNDDSMSLEKLSFKFSSHGKKQRIDVMLIPLERRIIQIGVGAFSDSYLDNSRKVFVPYKRKTANHQLNIFLKGQRRDLRGGD